jgi:hypothetical protein
MEGATFQAVKLPALKATVSFKHHVYSHALASGSTSGVKASFTSHKHRNVSDPEPPSAGPSLIRLHGPQLHELVLAQAASQGDEETNVDGVTFTNSHSRRLSRPT